MKVMWVTGNFRPLLGGLEIYIDRAVGSLAGLAEVHLVTQHGQGPASDGRVGHSVVAYLSRPGTQEQWKEVRRELYEQVAGFAPDVVHFANAGMAVYWDTLPGGVRVVATVHGNDLSAPWQWVAGRPAGGLIAEGLRRCDRVFAVSTHTEGLIAEAGVEAPVHVVTAGCDTDFFRPVRVHAEGVRRRYGIAPGRAIVLTVGRLVERKGHATVLAAMERVEGAHWVVVGDGGMRKGLLEAVARSPVRERFSLLRQVPDEDLLELYNACSVFVLTPEERRAQGRVDSEGFGLVLQEAGACGKAVVASDLSGCRDAVVDGATGLLVPAGDVIAVAAAIRNLLDDPALAERLGTAARMMVQGAGGWGRFAEQTMGHYQEVLGEREGS